MARCFGVALLLLCGAFGSDRIWAASVEPVAKDAQQQSASPAPSLFEPAKGSLTASAAPNKPPDIHVSVDGKIAIEAADSKSATLLEYARVLVWPVVVLILVLAFRKKISDLVDRLRHIHGPWDTSGDFAEKVEEAKSLSEAMRGARQKDRGEAEMNKPEREANAWIAARGLRPSPSGLDFGYYRALAQRDPSLALAGLRMEIEVMLSNLVRMYDVEQGQMRGARQMARRLLDAGRMDSGHFLLLEWVVQLCNAAVHGTPVTVEQSNAVLDSADAIRAYYLGCLSSVRGEGSPARNSL